MKMKRYYDAETVHKAVEDIADAAKALYGCDRSYVFGMIMQKLQSASIFVCEDDVSMSVITKDQ